MKFDILSPFVRSDFLCTYLARLYSNEQKEAFFVSIGEFESYDITSVSGNTRVEVKYETTPERTGNVAIEYWNTDFNKPSGIFSTGANLWLHVIKEATGVTAYEFNINVLRKLVVEHGTCKSNGRNSLCKIIPVSEIIKYAQRSFPVEYFTSLN